MRYFGSDHVDIAQHGRLDHVDIARRQNIENKTLPVRHIFHRDKLWERCIHVRTVLFVMGFELKSRSNSDTFSTPQ